MRLVYSVSKKEVKIGDEVELRDGKYIVDYITKPHKPSSTGRVGVKHKTKAVNTAEYFPGVIGAEWIEREDQE